MEKVKELYIKYKEIINYLIFGGLTTIVNFVAYYVSAKVFQIDEVVSSGISWFLSVLFAYITNKLFVFESEKVGLKNILKEMCSFFLARVLSGALCDVGTFAVMVNVLHINDIFAKIVTQIMVIVINYVSSKLFVFKDRSGKDKVK